MICEMTLYPNSVNIGLTIQLSLLWREGIIVENQISLFSYYCKGFNKTDDFTSPNVSHNTAYNTSLSTLKEQSCDAKTIDPRFQRSSLWTAFTKFFVLIEKHLRLHNVGMSGIVVIVYTAACFESFTHPTHVVCFHSSNLEPFYPFCLLS